MTTSARLHSQRGLALLEALFALGLASLAVWAAQQLMLARAQQASLQLHRAMQPNLHGGLGHTGPTNYTAPCLKRKPRFSAKASA